MNDTLEKAIRDRDSLARRLAGRFEETVKLRTRIEELEIALAAAEGRGRQQMIDALRGIADHPASVWELIRRKIPGQFADGTEHRAVTRAIHLAADYLESIAKEATPDTHAPPLLTPGTVVRIPGPDVDYVVNKGLETSGPKATLTFTTVDGLDWAAPRGYDYDTEGLGGT